MSLRSIVAALGGDLYDRGRRANVPAPGHSPADRSVSLLLSRGRVVVHSFGGADWRAVVDDLRARGLVDADGAPRSAARVPGVPADLSVGDRLTAARRLWDSAGPAWEATLTARNLRLRGVERDVPTPGVLRHAAAAPLSVYRSGERTMPALVIAISGPDGEFSGIEVTYLAPSGRRAVGLRLPRKTVGTVPPSSAIRIDPAAPEMLVAEGFFTTLSATERFGLPGWALMSTRNLRSWSPPQGVRRVLVAADRGRDGERSAALLAARLRAAGLRVSVRSPPPPYGDWNEATGWPVPC
ncbi:MAG TPA: toprim domain-containing protein [Caulobacteraceae bacterium]|jgi:hypothetical protein